MSCAETRAELVGFHFGALPAQSRELVERHLLGCAACLAGYLAVKRELELGDEQVPEPSEQSRLRLRRAVAELVRPAPQRWAWWQRPLAFAGGVALVLAAMTLTFRISTAEPTPPVALSQRTGAS